MHHAAKEAPLGTASEADTLGVAQAIDLTIPSLLEARWSGVL